MSIPDTTSVEFGFDDGTGSTFGEPNLYEGGTITQNFSAYRTSNSAPVFTGSPVRTTLEGSPYSFSAQTTDAEAHTVVVTVVEKPAWLTFSGNILSGTVPDGAVGLHRIELRATDSQGATTPLKFDLLIESSGGGGFAEWAGGAAPDSDDDGNGYVALSEYALGASAPGASFEKPAEEFLTIDEVKYFTLTAVVRVDDPDLMVSGESSLTLFADWDDSDVDSILSSDQSNVPSGFERRTYRTPVGSAEKKFIRLNFNLTTAG